MESALELFFDYYLLHLLQHEIKLLKFLCSINRIMEGVRTLSYSRDNFNSAACCYSPPVFPLFQTTPFVITTLVFGGNPFLSHSHLTTSFLFQVGFQVSVFLKNLSTIALC